MKLKPRATGMTEDMLRVSRSEAGMTPHIPGLFPEHPKGFVKIPPEKVNGVHGIYYRKVKGRGTLKVMCSAMLEDDGRLWLHVSLSRSTGLPIYKDMSLVKDTFIGEHRRAIQVFPPKDEYVSLYPVLHLWALADENEDMGLPDFRKDGGRQI